MEEKAKQLSDKDELILEMVSVSDAIGLMIERMYAELEKNPRYQELKNKLNTILDELDKMEGRK